MKVQDGKIVSIKPVPLNYFRLDLKDYLFNYSWNDSFKTFLNNFFIVFYMLVKKF